MVRRKSSNPTCPIRESSECSTEPTRTDGCLGEVSAVECHGIVLSGNSHSMPLSPFGQMGKIRSRTSTASILLRKWQDTYWVHLLPATLVIFRSELEFKKWAERGDYSSRKSRKVLLYVDFDTLGILTGHSDKEKGLNSSSLLSNSKGSSAKLVSKLQKYSLGDVVTTLHGNEALFVFNLDRISNVAVDAVASFASVDQYQLRLFRRVIYECIQVTSRSKKRGGAAASKGSNSNSQFRCREEDTHIASTVAESEMTSYASRPGATRRRSNISSARSADVFVRPDNQISSAQPRVVRRAASLSPQPATGMRRETNYSPSRR